MTAETPATSPVTPAPAPAPASTAHYRLVKKRHPWRGLFFGLLLGVGLGLMAIIYGWYWVGQYTPWLLVVVGIVFGLLVSFVPRPGGDKAPPTSAPTT
jgi:hypothetical protein